MSCCDSGGAGGSPVIVVCRLTIGVDPEGVPYDPTLADEFPVFCCLNDVVGGGVADLPCPKPPNMSSNDLSLYDLAGGEAKAPMISALPVRLKKGLFALVVDSAGLAN